MATGWPMKTTYANGDVYSASDVNDTNGTINLLGSSVAYAAGKNRIINGDFEVWQRGTSFSNPATGAYTADRFSIAWDGLAATRTISQQTFTPGTAPVAGYEGEYFYRWAQTVAGTGTLNQILHKIEDVRTLAGQSVTVSFWAKAASSRSIGVFLGQRFGTGGSAYAGVISSTASLTTSWQRFTFTGTAPSLTGKTIGAGNNLELLLDLGVTTFTIDVWGVQVEQGSTATAFQTATGTIQGELAACQRYYWNATTANNTIGAGVVSSATNAFISVKLPQTMRIVPTLTYTTASTLEAGGSAAVTAATIAVGGLDGVGLACTTSGLIGGRGAILYVTTGSFQFSSEL
jgi:hypothetical protein